jgi:integrase
VTLTERLRYPLMAALRQALEAGIRYGYLTRNPAKLAGPNPMPDPREIRVYTPDELKAIVDELGPLEATAVRFAAATGLRPAEWASVERRDVDKSRRIVFVPRHEDAQVAARGSAYVGGSRCTRLRPATDRQPLRLHHVTKVPRKERAGAVRRGELPTPRVGSGDRLSRDREAREDL